MPHRETNPESLDSIAYRLKLTRKALGYTQPFIAHLIGATTHSTWSNYERSERRIDLDHALRLCSATSVTLEWIYRGNLSGLPADVASKIIAEMEKEAPPKRR
jgi:transcriptional regulator with XRE-family HTH domain